MRPQDFSHPCFYIFGIGLKHEKEKLRIKVLKFRTSKSQYFRSWIFRKDEYLLIFVMQTPSSKNAFLHRLPKMHENHIFGRLSLYTIAKHFLLFQIFFCKERWDSLVLDLDPSWPLFTKVKSGVFNKFSFAMTVFEKKNAVFSKKAKKWCVF